MRRIQSIFLICLIAGGALLMRESLFSMTYYNSARGAPGPGFLPFWLSLGLIGFATTQLLKIVRLPQVDDTDEWYDKDGRWRIGFALASLAILLLLFERLGFVVSITLFVAIAAFGLGFRHLISLTLVSLGAGFGLYLLFDTLLGSSLPRGLFSF